MRRRVGLIGAGAMGSHHATILASSMDSGEVAAIADVDLGRAREVAEAHGGEATDDPHAVIADPGVDMVIVASADDSHEAYVLDCLKHGKPVLCEKPLAPTAEAAARIVAAEQETGRHLVTVGFMRRWDEEYLQLRGMLGAGTVGTPVMMHFVHRNPSAPPGFGSEMLITSSVSHEIDALRWITGTEITEATVFMPRSVSEQRADPQLVLLRTAEGVLADVEIFVSAQYGYEVRSELVTDRATLTTGLPGGVQLRQHQAASQAVTQDFRERFAQAYQRQLREWLRDSPDKVPTGASAWDGYAAALVADACIESQRTGRTVPIEVPERPDFYR